MGERSQVIPSGCIPFYPLLSPRHVASPRCSVVWKYDIRNNQTTAKHNHPKQMITLKVCQIGKSVEGRSLGASGWKENSDRRTKYLKNNLPTKIYCRPRILFLLSVVNLVTKYLFLVTDTRRTKYLKNDLPTKIDCRQRILFLLSVVNLVTRYLFLVTDRRTEYLNKKWFDY